MDKKDLLVQLIQHLQQEIDVTMNAVNEAHALASHEQSKPENQYDTLALEAAYLAHGQSERIAELQRQVMLLNHFDFLEYNDDSRIAVGALVCVEELDVENIVSLTPNPSSNYFNLDFDIQAEGQITYMITELTGRIISIHHVDVGEGKNTVEVNHDLPIGIYHVAVRGENFNKMIPLVVSH